MFCFKSLYLCIWVGSTAINELAYVLKARKLTIRIIEYIQVVSTYIPLSNNIVIINVFLEEMQQTNKTQLPIITYIIITAGRRCNQVNLTNNRKTANL